MGKRLQSQLAICLVEKTGKPLKDGGMEGWAKSETKKCKYQKEIKQKGKTILTRNPNFTFPETIARLNLVGISLLVNTFLPKFVTMEQRILLKFTDDRQIVHQPPYSKDLIWKKINIFTLLNQNEQCRDNLFIDGIVF